MNTFVSQLKLIPNNSINQSEGNYWATCDEIIQRGSATYIEHALLLACYLISLKEKEQQKSPDLSYNIFVVLGILLSLFDIFKNGQQNELTKYLDIMINKILPFEFPDVIKSS